MNFITNDDVYDIKVDQFARPEGRTVQRYRVGFLNTDGELVDEGLVDYTHTLMAMEPPNFTADDLVLYAIRSLGFKRPHKAEEAKTFGWGSNNYTELLSTPEWTKKALDQEILSRVSSFFNKRPNYGLKQSDLTLSVDAPVEMIIERLTFLSRRGYLKIGQSPPTSYSFDAATYDRMEEFLSQKNTPILSGGYFKEVPLPAEFDDTYVFVLMPLREIDFPQGKYEGIIVPSIKSATNVNCFRATDRQNRQVIINQIYSQIKNSAICVAEISCLNPNVLIEIGIALTLGKEVYIYHDERILPRSKVPFYLKHVPLDGYSSDDEFISKLKTISLS